MFFSVLAASSVAAQTHAPSGTFANPSRNPFFVGPQSSNPTTNGTPSNLAGGLPAAGINNQRVTQSDPFVVPPTIDPNGTAIVTTIDQTPLLQPGTITAAQNALTGLGLYRGPLNGTLTAQTRSAIRQFQEGAALPPTGELDLRTTQALGLGTPTLNVVAANQPAASAAASATTAATAQSVTIQAAQERLVQLGFLSRMAVTGVVDDATTRALIAMQISTGLIATGTLDEATLFALGVGGTNGVVSVPANPPAVPVFIQLP
jgi:peptidoglycan hydrolase-like protein with peptidoglycan-binding domain